MPKHPSAKRTQQGHAIADRREVVWIIFAQAQGNRIYGIGVQFAESPDGETARARIESILAVILGSEKPTRTM